MIRLAEQKDFQALQDLLSEISQLHHELRPDLFKHASVKFDREGLEEFLRNPEQSIFVYERDGRVLGHLFLKFKVSENKVRHPKKSLYIEDLCVAKEARHQGIGHELLQFAEEFGRMHQAYNITLNVWYANQDAYVFYDKADYKPQQIQMEKIL
ncbi:GNAT family N-acetyltransferase [Streptococcus uberis]|nr:GNAT family N-acetyltransferase [Streptococcus uberis]